MLRWGFKTEANEISLGVRREMGLAPRDPLDPWKLAEHLAIPVVSLTELARSAPDVLRQLTVVDPSAFSAATIFRGPQRLIVNNDAHALTRQAADVAHELAHGLLQHPPAPALDGAGCRDWDATIEEEANWLGPALLVSEPAALWVARRRLTLAEAARKYGVSKKLMRFRLNVTGAHRRT